MVPNLKHPGPWGGGWSTFRLLMSLCLPSPSFRFMPTLMVLLANNKPHIFRAAEQAVAPLSSTPPPLVSTWLCFYLRWWVTKPVSVCRSGFGRRLARVPRTGEERLSCRFCSFMPEWKMIFNAICFPLMIFTHAHLIGQRQTHWKSMKALEHQILLTHNKYFFIVMWKKINKNLFLMISTDVRLSKKKDYT